MLPYEFLLLCKLFDITPKDVLNDFMLAVSAGSFKRAGRETRMQKALDYFLECRYGSSYYTHETKQAIFQELNAVGMLWPTESKMKMIDLHAKWRDKYLSYWFKKWYRQPRRKT